MILGQLAIALHLAPTIIEAPTVLGVAGLGLVGALMVIVLLGHATAAREVLGVRTAPVRAALLGTGDQFE